MQGEEGKQSPGGSTGVFLPWPCTQLPPRLSTSTDEATHTVIHAKCHLATRISCTTFTCRREWLPFYGRGGVRADDVNTSDRDGGGVMDELDDGRAHLKDLDVTWACDLDAFLHKSAQQTPAAGEAGDETAEMMRLMGVRLTPLRPR